MTHGNETALLRLSLAAVVLVLTAELLYAPPARGDSRRASIGSAGAIFDTVGTRCPYSFQGGMPPGVFCVYEGVLVGSDGQPCGDRELVIWARLAPELDPNDAVDESMSDRFDVYFGFVTSPDLVLRAAVDADAENRGTMIDYRFGHDEPRSRLRGTAELRVAGAAGIEGAEVLTLRLRRPVVASRTCAWTSFDGVFVGVMTLPSPPIAP